MGNKSEKLKIPERVNNIVDTIGAEFKHRFGNEPNLILFGSWMKGTAKKQSDIDLAIECKASLRTNDLMAFRDWIDELPTLYSIDLVDMEYADESLIKEINQYGKVL